MVIFLQQSCITDEIWTNWYVGLVLFFSVLILHQMQPSFSSLHQSKGFHILKMVKVLVSGISIPLPAKASLSSGGVRETASIICILIISIQCTPRNVAVLYVGKSETASGVSFAIPPPFADSLLCICTQNCQRVLDIRLILALLSIVEEEISLHILTISQSHNVTSSLISMIPILMI